MALSLPLETMFPNFRDGFPFQVICSAIKFEAKNAFTTLMVLSIMDGFSINVRPTSPRCWIFTDQEVPSLNFFITFYTSGQRAGMPATVLPEPAIEPVWTSQEGSMARDTALNRWPRIVQAMVDDVTFAAKSTNEPQRLEAEELTKSLDSIREEIVADAALK